MMLFAGGWNCGEVEVENLSSKGLRLCDWCFGIQKALTLLRGGFLLIIWGCWRGGWRCF